MKKILPTLFLLPLIFFGVFFYVGFFSGSKQTPEQELAPSQSVPVEAENEGWTFHQFTSKDGNLSLYSPPDWKLVESVPDLVQGAFETIAPNRYGIGFNLGPRASFNRTEEEISRLPRITVENFVINGMDAKYYTGAGGDDILYMYAIEFAPDKVLFFGLIIDGADQLKTDQISDEMVIAQFTQMVKSVKKAN